jgi:ribonuclease D
VDPVPRSAVDFANAGDDRPAPEAPATTPLHEPADGVPPVLTEPDELRRLAAALAAGTGPVAVDAERASGYRYGQRAYLVQLRRAGTGTALVDPVALPDLSSLSEALDGVEWVLHAASQDLPCLAEVGMRPSAVFDTELAGRLLGRERVGLAALVAEELGLGLAKEHSAVDWSTRPLPPAWLRYAALDVELLLELRASMAVHLAAAGKSEWAAQEFEAVRLAPGPAPRAEPWRRLSGLHQLRDTRRLAVARELWTLREDVARARDLSPGRVLPDAAIIAAAHALPRTAEQLAALPQFSGRNTRRRAPTWQSAIDRGLALPPAELPARRVPGGDTLPPPRAWADRDPEAAARLERVRAAVRAVAARHVVPQENLLAPETQRRLAWSPPPAAAAEVRVFLVAAGARPWQVDLLADVLTGALQGTREPGGGPPDVPAAG